MQEPDWPSIEADYTKTLDSIRSIASKHGAKESTVRSRAKKCGWVRNAHATREALAEVIEAIPAASSQYELADMARKLSSVALTVLQSVAKTGKSEGARVAAATKLLEIGFGKPLGIASGSGGTEKTSRAHAQPAQPKQTVMGKKAALIHEAKNPDSSTTMGALMARRGQLKVVKSK